MSVAIVDYGSGNLRSAAKAFERSAAELGLDIPVKVTDRADEVAAASHVVLPGVGAFADCRAGLGAVDGMIEAIRQHVIVDGGPFLGICVGMQLMAEAGLEHGRTEGLGWIEGEVVAIEPAPAPDGRALKVPHMGWNRLDVIAPAHPVLAGLNGEDYVYFVHSYHLRARERSAILAQTDYGGPVTAIVGRDNMVGTQFHPEKSQAAGLRLIRNFLTWKP